MRGDDKSPAGVRAGPARRAAGGRNGSRVGGDGGESVQRVAVAPVGSLSNCFALTAKTVDYRVSFAASATAPPDVVATIAPCNAVTVTVGRKPSTPLDVGAFGPAVARALGQSELTFEQ